MALFWWYDIGYMKNFNRGGGFGGGSDRGDRNGGGGFRGGFGGGNRGGGGYDSRPREMFRAVCDECGRDCEVPFRPTGARPVLCSNCFEAKNGPRTDRRPARQDDTTRVRRFERDGSPIETREERENRNLAMLREEVVKVNEKLDKLIGALLAKPAEEPVKKAKKTKKVEEVVAE